MAKLFTSLNIFRCLNGTFPWRNCSVNDLIKNLFKDIVKEQFLYRIVSLWRLVYRKFLSLPWQRSFILEVNSFAPNLFGFLNSRIKWYFCPMTLFHYLWHLVYGEIFCLCLDWDHLAENSQLAKIFLLPHLIWFKEGFFLILSVLFCPRHMLLYSIAKNVVHGFPQMCCCTFIHSRQI